jgi:hypothetical protein
VLSPSHRQCTIHAPVRTQQHAQCQVVTVISRDFLGDISTLSRSRVAATFAGLAGGLDLSVVEHTGLHDDGNATEHGFTCACRPLR